jgi:Flp pilus assembly protein TadD
MTTAFSGKHFLWTSMMVSALALSACGTTGSTAGSASAKPSGSVDVAIEKALDQAEAQGDTQQTLALMEQMYQRDPSNAVVATRFARVLREDEQLNKARLVLNSHVDGDKADVEAVTEMSMVHLGLGQYKDAEQYARQAVTMDESNGRAYLALGTALDAQNYHEQAEVAFRKGLDNWKGDPAPILNNLALNLASQGHLEEALGVLEKARKISPRRTEIERNFRIISTLQETAIPDESPAAGGPPQEAPVPARKPERS